MSTKNDGGPAFPCTGVIAHDNEGKPMQNGWAQDPQSGLTIRDYFAAKALSGMLADPNVKASASKVSSIAYGFADAMIAERSK